MSLVAEMPTVCVRESYMANVQRGGRVIDGMRHDTEGSGVHEYQCVRVSNMYMIIIKILYARSRWTLGVFLCETLVCSTALDPRRLCEAFCVQYRTGLKAYETYVKEEAEDPQKETQRLLPAGNKCVLLHNQLLP